MTKSLGSLEEKADISLGIRSSLGLGKEIGVSGSNLLIRNIQKKTKEYIINNKKNEKAKELPENTKKKNNRSIEKLLIYLKLEMNEKNIVLLHEQIGYIDYIDKRLLKLWFRLIEGPELSKEEIALVLGIKPEEVISRRNSAIKQLKKNIVRSDNVKEDEVIRQEGKSAIGGFLLDRHSVDLHDRYETKVMPEVLPKDKVKLFNSQKDAVEYIKSLIGKKVKIKGSDLKRDLEAQITQVSKSNFEFIYKNVTNKDTKGYVNLVDVYIEAVTVTAIES